MVGRSWADVDPIAVIGVVYEFPMKARYRSRLLGYALGQWWNRDAAAASAYLEELELPEAQAAEVESQLASVMAKDPKHAGALLSSATPRLAGEITSLVASRDAEQALAMSQSLLNGQKKNWALLFACETIAKRDPDAMVERLPQLATELSGEWPQHQALEDLIMPRLRVQGREVMEAWLDQLPWNFRKSFWDSYAKAWAEDEPGAALDYLTSQRVGRMQGDAMNSILEAWAHSDPETAADRALQIEDGEFRANAVERVMRVWKADDPSAADDWSSEH